MTFLGALLFVLAVLVFWSLNLIGLPGNWMIVAATVLYAWLTSGPGSGGLRWAAVAIVMGLAVVGEVVEFGASATGVKRAGGSRRGAVLALVGSVGGAMTGLFVGVPGLTATAQNIDASFIALSPGQSSVQRGAVEGLDAALERLERWAGAGELRGDVRSLKDQVNKAGQEAGKAADRVPDTSNTALPNSTETGSANAFAVATAMDAATAVSSVSSARARSMARPASASSASAARTRISSSPNRWMVNGSSVACSTPLSDQGLDRVRTNSTASASAPRAMPTSMAACSTWACAP